MTSSYAQKIDYKYLVGTWYRISVGDTLMFKFIDSTHLIDCTPFLEDSSSELSFRLEKLKNDTILVLQTPAKDDSTQIIYFKFKIISKHQFSLQMFKWHHFNWQDGPTKNTFIDEEIPSSTSRVHIWTKKSNSNNSKSRL
jgi:hypothetical protein